MQSRTRWLGRRLRTLVLALSAPLLGASYWPLTNDADVAAGQKAYREGAYDVAVSAFTRAMRGHGDPDRLQFDLGTALLQSAMVAADEKERTLLLDRAIAALRSATDSHEGVLREDALFNLGNALALRLRYDDALASYRELLISNTEHADGRHNFELVLAAKNEAGERGPGFSKSGQAANEGQGEGQGTGQAGEPVPEGAQGQAALEGQGPAAEGEGGDLPATDAQEPQRGQSGDAELAAASRGQVEAGNPDINPEQDKGPDNFTIVQKLDALERRSGELRRGNLLRKSRSRLRDPNKKQASQ